jgi:predicted AAA+ superfamily ATPase
MYIFVICGGAYIMERQILNELLRLKESKYRKPLILKGVRQVGKTWVLKEFGKRYYKNTAYLFFAIVK